MGCWLCLGGFGALKGSRDGGRDNEDVGSREGVMGCGTGELWGLPS